MRISICHWADANAEMDAALAETDDEDGGSSQLGGEEGGEREGGGRGDWRIEGGPLNMSGFGCLGGCSCWC